jgi:hypothetical protein
LQQTHNPVFVKCARIHSKRLDNTEKAAKKLARIVQNKK